jgi:hypothetical protein
MAGGDRIAEALQLVRTRLQKLIDAIAYQYNGRSPLADLEAGVRKVFDPQQQEKIAPVFDVLRNAAPS